MSMNDGKIIMILIKNNDDSQDDVEEVEDVDQSPNSVPILLDLAFASNVWTTTLKSPEDPSQYL